MNAHAHNCGLCRIEVDHLGVVRGGHALLSDVNMHIHCGQLTALVGPNGAGKTTLLRALLGEIPFAGQVKHLQADGSPAVGVRTGYVPQHLDFDRSAPVTVQDFLAAALSGRAVWRGIPRNMGLKAQEALAVTQCEGLIHRRMGQLSGGELQRVLLALALTPQPDLLILDEPVSGVDMGGLALFYRTVLKLRTQHHMAILLVSHDFSVVKAYADQAVLLNQKVLAQGTPEEVMASKVFAQAFHLQEGRPWS